jgi:CRP/FNR family transcriptional regulator, cyclic AMP receptor protein
MSLGAGTPSFGTPVAKGLCTQVEVVSMVLLDMLEEMDFVRGMAPEYLAYLANVGRLKEYDADTVLFREGQPAAHIYLISRGVVALELHMPDEGHVRIQVLGPGELAGWSPVLVQGPMTATARTLGRCRVVALDVERIRALCDRDPRFGQEFLRRTAVVLARRLDATRRRLLAKSFLAAQTAPTS